VYDCAIEENTMEYLKKCNFAHSPREERPGLGQNIWEFSDNNYDKSAAAARAMNDWFAELAQHGVPGDNILSDKVLYKIGHYSQMVWQSSYRLGCGVHSCPHMMFVACEYGPAGNIFDHPIYDVGDPCTTDGDCNDNGDSQTCLASTTEQPQQQAEEAHGQAAKETQKSFSLFNCSIVKAMV
ncbi:SCP-like protein, partial [Teladorsagia circumcincta]